MSAPFTLAELATRVLTHDLLRQLLHYDEATGAFTWLVSRQRVKAGDAARPKCNAQGYKDIKIGGKLYAAHRLAWLYTRGCWPDGQVDHINGDRGDNRACNLRLATNRQNQQNQKKRSDNSSGLKGVSWNSARRKWIAQIKVAGEKKYLGGFDTAAEAHSAYVSAANAAFGEFARAA